MAVLNISKSAENSFNSVSNLLQKEYASIIEVLEKAYSNNCGEASLAEKTSEIKIIADRAQEFAEKHQFFRLYNAVSHAFEKIETLKNSQKDNDFNLPKSINVSLINSIMIHMESIKSLFVSCQNIIDIRRYGDNSSKKDLIRWAEALEILGDSLEDNIDFFNIENLEEIQFLMSNLVQLSRNKQSNFQTRTNVKDSYRIRIRNAAGFIFKLIDSVMEESEEEEREILAVISSANHPAFFEV
jgi:hypothetical protein